MTKSLLKKSALLVLALVAVLCVFWITVLIPASGGYRITKSSTASSPPSEAGWAEISPFLPLLHLYGEAGESPLSFVLVPIAQRAIPLKGSVPLLGYHTDEDGTVHLSPPKKDGATSIVLSKLPGEETQAVRTAWQKAADARARRMAELLAIKPPQNGWTSDLGAGEAILTLPPDYVFRRGEVHALDDRDESYLKIAPARGRAIPDLGKEFERRYIDYAHSDDDIYIAENKSGSYSIRALRELDNDTWLFDSRAKDLRSAKVHLSIIRSLQTGGKPLRIVGEDTDFLHSPVLDRYPGFQEAFNRKMTAWLEGLITPLTILNRSAFGKRTPSVTAQNEAGQSLFANYTMQLRVFEKDSKPTIEGAEVLAKAADAPVQIDVVPPSELSGSLCIAHAAFPLLPAGDAKELVLWVYLRSASLPDCRLAAQALVAFSRTDFAGPSTLEAIAPLSEHFGRYDRATPAPEDLILLRKGRSGAVINMAGETLRPLAENTSYQILRDDLLLETANPQDQQKTALYTLKGEKIVSLDYDDLYTMGETQGMWHSLFQAKKEGKYALYDLENRKEIAPPIYDKVRVIREWDFVFAQRGEVIDILQRDGTSVVPGGIDSYIFASPMRSPPPRDDFIAVKRARDGKWQFLTHKPIALLDGTFADVTRVSHPVERIFRLTSEDGSVRTVTVTRDGKVERVETPSAK